MDLPSDSDESDVDFVPQAEAESSDSPTDDEKTEDDQTKRKAKSKKPDKKRAKVDTVDAKTETKGNEDDLWASFLSDAPEKSNEDNTPEVKEVPIRRVKPELKPSTVKSGGLSSILQKLGKNSKVSTLEKSKMDWNNFKKDEGIDEELSIHNRGRGGYLERQDFLQRTDLRQFEIEKNMRQGKRSTR